MIAACVILKGTPTGGGGTGGVPVADFSLPVMAGPVGTIFPFVDRSTNVPTAWAWTVNGFAYSNMQNPSFYASSQGIFNVQLTASNSFGSNTSPVHSFFVS